MKDWERKLMGKVVEDMRGGEQICLRNYSEAMMWYSGKRLLEVAPDIKRYILTSGRTTLLDVNNNLYMRTMEGFDPLGKTSELLSQLGTQKPQTDDEQRATKAQEMLDSFGWLKSEALKRLNEEIPGLEIDSVDLVSIGHEPFNEDWPAEDGDMMLWITLELCLLDVSIEQLDKLTSIDGNSAVVHRVNMEETPITYEVWYTMIYDFTSWDGKLEDNFAK